MSTSGHTLQAKDTPSGLDHSELTALVDQMHQNLPCRTFLGILSEAKDRLPSLPNSSSLRSLNHCRRVKYFINAIRPVAGSGAFPENVLVGGCVGTDRLTPQPGTSRAIRILKPP